MHLPTLRGNFSVSLPLCVLANRKKPSGCGTRVEFISLAVSELRLVPLIRAEGAQAVFRGLQVLGGGAPLGVPAGL